MSTRTLRYRRRGTRASMDGWLATLSRFIGLLGLIYELVIDKLHNPTALMVFGGLAGLPEIWSFQRTAHHEVITVQDEEEDPS